MLDKNEEYLRYESLNAVANINPPEAVKYANKHLNGKTFESIDLEMARLLAKEDPSSTKLKEYIAQLLAAKDDLDGWLYQYFELFSLMNIPDKDDHFFTPRNNAKDTTKKEIAETMLAQLIDDEYLIHISNDRFDKKLRISESGKRSTYLSRSDADRIYKDERLLNDLISRKPNDITWLRKIVSCLEVKTSDKYIVTLHTDLHPNSSITIDGDSPLQKDKIFGKVWLTVSDEGKLVASYRDHAGEIRRGKVKVLNNFSESKFSYQYIEKDLHTFIEEEQYF